MNKMIIKKQLIRSSALLLVILASCSSNDDPFPASVIELDYSAPISLIGSVENTDEISTRGVGAIEGTGKELSISLFRADETYGATYASGPHAAAVTSGSSFDTGLYYQGESTKKTKLIGVYPAVDGTTVTWDADNCRVSYPAIDGATDIMASSLIEGSKSAPMGGMTFGHLLTQVKIIIVATSEGVGKWGNVTEVTIGGKKQSIVVQLPAATANAGTGASIHSATGTADLAVTTSIGGTPTAAAPTATEAVFGYAMFAPTTTASEVLTLKVNTSVLSKALEVEAEPEQFKAGSYYELTLSFTATGITLTTVSITEWGSGTGQTIPIG